MGNVPIRLLHFHTWSIKIKLYFIFDTQLNFLHLAAAFWNLYT